MKRDVTSLLVNLEYAIGNDNFEDFIRDDCYYVDETKLVEKMMESLDLLASNQMKEKEYYKELELDKVSEIHEISIVFGKKHCIVR